MHVHVHGHEGAHPHDRSLRRESNARVNARESNAREFQSGAVCVKPGRKRRQERVRDICERLQTVSNAAPHTHTHITHGLRTCMHIMM